MRLLLRLLINAAALWVATQAVPGISFSGDWRLLLVVALVFGVLNVLVRPVLIVLTFPFLLLTLGLFTLVLNAFMLWLTSALSEALGLGFYVRGFWAAFLGALVVSLVSFALSVFLVSERRAVPSYNLFHPPPPHARPPGARARRSRAPRCPGPPCSFFPSSSLLSPTSPTLFPPPPFLPHHRAPAPPPTLPLSPHSSFPLSLPTPPTLSLPSLPAPPPPALALARACSLCALLPPLTSFPPSLPDAAFVGRSVVPVFGVGDNGAQSHARGPRAAHQRQARRHFS